MPKTETSVVTTIKIELNFEEAAILQSILREAPMALDSPDCEDPATLSLRTDLLTQLGNILS